MFVMVSGKGVAWASRQPPKFENHWSKSFKTVPMHGCSPMSDRSKRYKIPRQWPTHIANT